MVLVAISRSLGSTEWIFFRSVEGIRVVDQLLIWVLLVAEDGAQRLNAVDAKAQIDDDRSLVPIQFEEDIWHRFIGFFRPEEQNGLGGNFALAGIDGVDLLQICRGHTRRRSASDLGSSCSGRWCSAPECR